MLYGFLGKQFGRVHRYDVASPAEAVRALSVTLDGFRKAVIDGGAYRVLVAGRDALTAERTPNPTSDRETIRIVPVVAGAGNVGKIIVGAALIYFSAGILAPAALGVTAAGGSAAAAAAAGSFLGISAATYSSIGISLVIGGVASMLFSPQPQQRGTGPSAVNNTSERPENKPSYAFDGAVNTVRQGNPVPVFLGGPMKIGSQVVSAGLSADEI